MKKENKKIGNLQGLDCSLKINESPFAQGSTVKGEVMIEAKETSPLGGVTISLYDWIATDLRDNAGKKAARVSQGTLRGLPAVLNAGDSHVAAFSFTIPKNGRISEAEKSDWGISATFSDPNEDLEIFREFEVKAGDYFQRLCRAMEHLSFKTKWSWRAGETSLTFSRGNRDDTPIAEFRGAVRSYGLEGRWICGGRARGLMNAIEFLAGRDSSGRFTLFPWSILNSESSLLSELERIVAEEHVGTSTV